jgi:peroxiredoxin
MKYFFSILLSVICLGAASQITTIAPGAPAPSFSLPDVTGKTISFADFPEAKGFILAFTCNTCPVAQAYEQRIIDLNTKYAPLGYPVIAINPNDPELAKGDNFEAMKERAKNRNYSFPYLFDKGQATTNAYGARATPHIFLVEKKNNANTVVYTGAVDNDPENTNSSKVNYLDQAIQAISEGKAPATASTRALGCSVKRKKS